MKNILSIVLVAGLAVTTSCNNAADNRQQMAQQRVIDSMRMELAHQRTVDSMVQIAKAQDLQIATMKQTAKAAPVAKKTTTTRSYAARPRTRVIYRQASNYSNASYGGYSSAPVVAQQPQRRGWSAKAKGAVIGTGVGAISGAIINGRNRGVGALIGGVAGAAAGTGIGAIIDRKHGR